jgi:hypothetical protein
MAHFSQAQGTPFTTPPLSECMGYEGYRSPPIHQSHDKGVDILLQKLTDGIQLAQMDDKLTVEEVRRGFRKWAEETSTSPSVWHLGHYRCLFEHDAKKPNSEKTTDQPSISGRIMMVYYHVMMAALRSGTLLKRWQNSTTAMIE